MGHEGLKDKELLSNSVIPSLIKLHGYSKVGGAYRFLLQFLKKEFVILWSLTVALYLVFLESDCTPLSSSTVR